jgi:hypothetical protein
MHQFSTYFQIGFEHIISWQGLDHILFIAALCLRYQFADWRKILILVTAFTIGHSITLMLAFYNIISFSRAWIEFLIPVTIAITAFSNLFVKKFAFKSRFPLIYFFALFFGLVHGLGFSNSLKAVLGTGSGVVAQLLTVILGIEVGQLVVVLAILLISSIFVFVLKTNRREYLLYISGGIFALALQMAIQRYPLHI